MSQYRINVWPLFATMFLLYPIDGFQTKSQGLKNHQQSLIHDHLPYSVYPTLPSTSSTTACFAESSKKEGASIRFSGSDATLTNPLDAFLSFVASDVTSIALGLIGLFFVVGNRLAGLDLDTAENLTVQTRTDLLATFACGSVLLNGITKLDVTSALAEAVVLEGQALPEAELLDTDSAKLGGEKQTTMLWALDSLLVATPAKTAIILEKQQSSDGDWRMVARAGIVSSTTDIPESTPILKRVATPGNTKETYLPTLQALPGKTEFPYLPSNSQLCLLIPFDDNNQRVLVLGGNMAKSFSPRDVAWARIIAERMGNSE
ncbi:unnamed protein product [Cylindrotheca closterium]|uniref:Uncharacterized protein n=1 Tax=Cylindrotheca closterium TaxID=2856 RepID=A0AAD2CBE8_9STRA|nr:unnamed protein product [Cylindrotheca closterium]